MSTIRAELIHCWKLLVYIHCHNNYLYTGPSQSAITLIPSYLTATSLWSSLSSNITGMLTATPTLQVTKGVSSQSFITLTSTMQTSMFSTVFISSTQLSKSIESVSTPITQTSLTVQLPLSRLVNRNLQPLLRLFHRH